MIVREMEEVESLDRVWLIRRPCVCVLVCLCVEYGSPNRSELVCRNVQIGEAAAR